MDDDHVYHRRTIEGGAELVALQGNLARHEDGHAFTHLHVVLSDDDLVPAAGHLFEQRCDVTQNFTFAAWTPPCDAVPA